MQLYNIRLYTNILFSILLLFCGVLNAFSTTYEGRVVDTNGNAIAYATVYPEVQPELGTATNNDGHFSFNAILTDLIFSRSFSRSFLVLRLLLRP